MKIKDISLPLYYAQLFYMVHKLNNDVNYFELCTKESFLRVEDGRFEEDVLFGQVCIIAVSLAHKARRFFIIA